MRRLLLVLLVLLIAVPAGAVVAAHVMLNGDLVRARIVESVRRATGREVTIGGPVQLAWSLAPTVEARDVSLLNPPGMSRPATAHLDRIEAQVALLPLLTRRVELRRIVLAGPDILLERDARGQPNWLAIRPEPVPSAQPAAASTERPFDVVLGTVEIRDARVAWRGGGPAIDATATRIDVAAETGRLDGQLTVSGVALKLAGTAGPPTASSVPLNVTLVGGGIAASLSGTTGQASLTVLTPDLATLGPFVGRALPSVRDVRLVITLSPSGPSAVSLQTGPAELGGGVRLLKSNAAAPTLAGPMTATGEIRVNALPIALAANAGSLQAVLGRGPIPLQLLAATGDATLSAQGTVADLRGSSFDLAVSGHAADVARLGELAGVAVPGLRDLAVDVHLTSSPSGLLLRGLRLVSAQGDVAGDLVAGLQPRASLRGSVVSQRLVLDGLALSSPPVPTPAAASGPAASPGPAPAPPRPAPAPVSPPDRLIPDLPLPFATLRLADADLHATIGEAVWRGGSYRTVDMRLLLQDGRLRLAPLSAQAPGGAVFAQIVADAAAQQVSVTARAPGLAAGPALGWLGAPESTKGTLDLDVQVRGEGPTLRALAATAEGHLGLAVVDGQIENRWLEGLLAEAMRAASLPVDTGGISRVRCAAIRADAAAGQVRLRALAVDTSRLRLEGEGGLNLANESLDLHLRPQLRLGTALSVPVRVAGTFRTPKVALDPGAIAPGRVGITIGGPPAADTCGPALALARDGQPGPAPTAPEPAARPSRPADLLRGLLR